MSDGAVPDPDLLLRHASFVRALARRLAADESAADDLVQDTWLAVLERPFASVHSPRRWLAGVLSNLWREKSRGEERRRRREHEAARAEATTPASEMLDAAATGRDLVSAVLDLEEPFRTAVLLRYYESLPPREIARRLAVPVKTVNSRLARGLERLRAHWRRTHSGDESSWLGALISLAGPSRWNGSGPTMLRPGAASTLSMGVLVMSAKVILSSAAAVGVGIAAILWTYDAAHDPTRDSDQSARPGIAALEHGAVLSAPDDSTRARIGETRRIPGEPTLGDEVGQPAPAKDEVRHTIRGRVLSAEALALAGVDVVFRRDEGGSIEGRARSTAGGRFELESLHASGIVTVEDPALVTLFYGSVRAHSAIEPLVVVAPFRDLAGRVVDELGRGLTGARVRLVLPSGFAARFDAAFDTTEGREWSTATDGEGRFELARAPIVDGSRIVAALDRFLDGAVAAPPTADREIEIVLAHPTADGPELTGRVEDPMGKSLSHARVTLGMRTTSTDEQGQFRMSLDGAESSSELVAIHRGYLPGRVQAEKDPSSGAVSWPDFVVVRVGATPRVLAGRVVDREGKPLADRRVWIADPTPFGILRDETKAQVEYLLASKADIDSDAELSQANWSSQETDAHGRFEIEGLLPRSYAVRVFDPKTLGARTFGPFEASTGGEPVTIVFDQGLLRRISGRIVSRGGHPIESARVCLMGAEFGGVWNDGGSVITAADGRFAFEGIGRNQIVLYIRGDDVVTQLHGISDGDGDQELEVTVSVRCHFKVDCAARDMADAIQVLDEQGERVPLSDVGASGETIGKSFALVDGRSKSLAVTSDARTLVLLKNDREVKRIPLELIPGQLNLLQP